MSLEFVVNDQQLRRVDTTRVVGNNKNVYTCKFNFIDSGWDELHKFAIFTDGWGTTIKVHLGKETNKLTCLVPDRVLKGAKFKVAVYGGDLLSTNNVTVPVIESGYHKHIHSKGKACSNKKDIFVEIFESLDTKIDNIAFSDDHLHVLCNNKLIESIYLPYLTEEDVNELIQVFADDFQEQLNNKADINHTHDLATTTDDGFMSHEDKEKLDGIDVEKLIIDTALDANSHHAVENRVIVEALNGKKDDFDFVEEIFN